MTTPTFSEIKQTAYSADSSQDLASDERAVHASQRPFPRRHRFGKAVLIPSVGLILLAVAASAIGLSRNSQNHIRIAVQPDATTTLASKTTTTLASKTTTTLKKTTSGAKENAVVKFHSSTETTFKKHTPARRKPVVTSGPTTTSAPVTTTTNVSATTTTSNQVYGTANAWAIAQSGLINTVIWGQQGDVELYINFIGSSSNVIPGLTSLINSGCPNATTQSDMEALLMFFKSAPVNLPTSDTADRASVIALDNKVANDPGVWNEIQASSGNG